MWSEGLIASGECNQRLLGIIRDFDSFDVSPLILKGREKETPDPFGAKRSEGEKAAL